MNSKAKKWWRRIVIITIPIVLVIVIGLAVLEDHGVNTNSGWIFMPIWFFIMWGMYKTLMTGGQAKINGESSFSGASYLGEYDKLVGYFMVAGSYLILLMMLLSLCTLCSSVSK